MVLQNSDLRMSHIQQPVKKRNKQLKNFAAKQRTDVSYRTETRRINRQPMISGQADELSTPLDSKYRSERTTPNFLQRQLEYLWLSGH